MHMMAAWDSLSLMSGMFYTEIKTCSSIATAQSIINTEDAVNCDP
jgi:hypothetical protein